MCCQSIRTCQNTWMVSTQRNVMSKTNTLHIFLELRREFCIWGFGQLLFVNVKATHKLDHFTKAPSERCDIWQHARPRGCFFPPSGLDNGRWNKEKRRFSPSLSFLIHSAIKNLRLVVDPKHNNRLTLSSLKHAQLCFQHGTHKKNYIMTTQS